jgi:hypothetical protein
MTVFGQDSSLVEIEVKEEEVPHNYRKPIMTTVYRYIMIDHGNILIGITGRVRHGKSHTGIHILYRWNKKLLIKDCLVYTVTELLKRTLCCILVDNVPISEETYNGFKDVTEMNVWLSQMQAEGRMRIKIGRAIVFDEAGAGVFVRSFFSQDNITISKIVQLWGMLRMLVIVVVPEHMGVAEKNLRQFMDVEIRMHKVYKSRGYATLTGYEYYDKSDPENPKKKRIRGCKYGGTIKVTRLPPEVEKEYEDISKVMKISALLELARGGREKESKRRALVPLEEAYMLARQYSQLCKNKKDQWEVSRIQVNTGCAYAMARQLKAQLEQEDRTGIKVS